MKFKIRLQSGISVLEFLVVIPVFFLLMYMAIEFGAVFVRANTLTKSVHVAARYLSAQNYDEISITDANTIAKNLILYANVTDTGSTILPGGISANGFDNPIIEHNYGGTDHVRVSVIYHHTPVGSQGMSGMLQMITGDTINYLSIDIPASSIMRYDN